MSMHLCREMLETGKVPADTVIKTMDGTEAGIFHIENDRVLGWVRYKGILDNGATGKLATAWVRSSGAHFFTTSLYGRPGGHMVEGRVELEKEYYDLDLNEKVDPGSEYTLLDTGEEIVRGDEFWYPRHGTWGECIESVGHNFPSSLLPKGHSIRRRKPKPSFTERHFGNPDAKPHAVELLPNDILRRGDVYVCSCSKDNVHQIRDSAGLTVSAFKTHRATAEECRVLRVVRHVMLAL